MCGLCQAERMKKSTASVTYVSSQSRGGLLVGLNFFALHIWHQCAESKGIFNTLKRKRLGNMPPAQDDTHTGYSSSEVPDLLYIYNTAHFTNSVFHFKFQQAAE